ncbi:hypothetical protein HZS_7244, partial [Henneguya salminicola]
QKILLPHIFLSSTGCINPYKAPLKEILLNKTQLSLLRINFFLPSYTSSLIQGGFVVFFLQDNSVPISGLLFYSGNAPSLCCRFYKVIEE